MWQDASYQFANDLDFELLSEICNETPSNPSPVLNRMHLTEKLADAHGHTYVVLTCDLQI